MAQIAGSIREFGFTNPLLVDTQAGILAGHGRLRAARKLGLEQVPVIILDHLSERELGQGSVARDGKLRVTNGHSGLSRTGAAVDVAPRGRFGG